MLAKAAGENTIVAALDDALLALARDVLEDPANAVSLMDLVGRFLGMDGQEPGMLPTSRQMEEIIHESAAALATEHDLLAPTFRHRGLSRLLAERLSELRLHGADEESLAEWAQQASPLLKEKLQMLAALEGEARARLDARGRTLPSERIKRCLLAEPEAAGIKHIVVLGSGEPNPLAEEWLRWAAGRGIKVDVILERLEGREGLFRPEAAAAARLGGFSSQTPGRPAWGTKLFSNESAEEGPELVILRAPDPLAEVEWALRRCARLISQEGVMPHRICLYARSLADYGPLVQAAAARLGVMASVPISVPLLTNGYTRSVLAALECLASPDVRGLLRVSRSSYFPSAPKFQAELWDVLKAAYRRRQGGWSAVEEWAAAAETEAAPWLSELLGWRREALLAPAPLGAWIGRLRSLVARAGLAEAACAKPATAERDQRANTVMEASLRDTEFASAGQGRELDLASFAAFCRRLWTGQLVFLPESSSGVKLVGRAQAIGDVDAVMALGLVEGSLPRRRREDPILSDEDRHELAAITQGKARLLDSREQASAERDEFVRLCCAPRRLLQLSYPASSDEQENVPALYLAEADRATGGRAVRVEKLLQELTPPVEEAGGGDAALAKALLEPSRPPDLPSLKTGEAREALAVDLEAGVDVGEVEDAAVCPFRRAARHRLKWRGQPFGSLFGLVSRVPKDARLALLDSLEGAEEILRSQYEARLEELYPDLEDWQAGLLASARDRLVSTWLRQEEAVRAGWPRGRVAAPARLEPPLFHDRPMKAGGRPYRLKGEAELASDERGVLRVDIGHHFLNFGSLSSGGSGLKLDNEWLMPGLFFLAGYRNDGHMVVEFRSGETRYMVSLLSTGDTVFKSSGDKCLEVRTVPEGRTEFMRGIKDLANQAITRIAESSVEAMPGEACARCPFGELCRCARDYGEQEDPFDKKAE